MSHFLLMIFFSLHHFTKDIFPHFFSWSINKSKPSAEEEAQHLISYRNNEKNKIENKTMVLFIQRLVAQTFLSLFWRKFFFVCLFVHHKNENKSKMVFFSSIDLLRWFVFWRKKNLTLVEGPVRLSSAFQLSAQLSALEFLRQVLKKKKRKINFSFKNY